MRLCASPSNFARVSSMRRGKITNSGIALVLILLVAIFGGLAWVVQYLPTRVAPKVDENKDNSPLKPSLVFTRYIAQWYPPKAGEKKEGEEGSPDDKYPSKDFEQGTDGFYDFLFKNIAETDMELAFFTTDCDCNSVQAISLPGAEADRLIKIHEEDPGVPLAYKEKPVMKDLPREPGKKTGILVKVGEGGVVRVNFNAKKSPGQQLNVRPRVWYNPVGDATRRGWQVLMAPVMVRQPVNFNPARVSVGILSQGGIAEGKLIAWSSTRTNINLDLGLKDDPFFAVKTLPLAKEEYSGLEETLKNEKSTATVRSAVHVTVTVNESTKDGKQLDLGAFYRKMPVYLDGVLNTDIQGPEIVGRVEGNLMIGGADDQGRVRFKSFDAENGGKKVVEISADEKAELKTHSHQPSWVEVSLKLDKKNAPPKRRIWILEARVPPNTPAVRSFEEPDAIVLQVTTGKAVRLVRIPIEGHIGGR